MFVVYRDATGTQVEQCDSARRHEISTSADIIYVTEFEDAARRAKGVEPRDLGNGLKLSGRIAQSGPPGPEHDRLEYLRTYRAPHASESITLHVWAKDDPADFAREERIAIAMLRDDLSHIQW